MTERLNFENNWEAQRRTRRFEVEPESKADTNVWLEAMGLPPVEDETYKDWTDRTAEERGTN